MRLFTLPAFRGMAGALATGVPALVPGECTLGRHANGELYVELQTPVDGVDCAALGTLRPPDRNLAEFLLLCDTLRRCGARSVLAILPYFAYARQDRYEAGCSLGAAWIGRLLGGCGVTRVLTLDIHSPWVAGLVPPPLSSLGSAGLFVQALGERLAGVTIVAPDEGAIERCELLRRTSGRSLATAHFQKQRSSAGVRSRLVGAVTGRVIIHDDILDTGGTLLACAEGLRAAGVRELAIAVTHGLFTGSDWQRLWDLGVDAIVCTDSVGAPEAADARVEVVPCAPALVPALRVFTEVNHVQA